MKILLFGGSGQLGFEIQKRSHDLNFEVVSPVISELDISEAQQVAFLTERIKPELIINCAAYTAVDKAETEKEAAYKINCDGARNVAFAAKAVGSRLIHISTDYVYDGSSTKPHAEDAPVNPLNVYGASKLAGERAIEEVLHGEALIIRTSSLHGQRGENFVHTMVKLFKEREVVKVVNDQFMSATYAGWLGEVVLDLGRTSAKGILHACCEGVISWFDFASEILRLVKPEIENGEKVRVEPVSAREFPRPAQRPPFSAMDCAKLSKILGRHPISWREGLMAHLTEIGFHPKAS